MAAFGWTWVVSAPSLWVYSLHWATPIFVWFWSFMALKMWEFACPWWYDLPRAFFLWHPRETLLIAPCFSSFLFHVTIWESLGLFCAFWTTVHVMGKDCLYYVCKLRWEAWEREMGGGVGWGLVTWEEMAEFWLFSFMCLNKFMSTLQLIYKMALI